jgi:hypothetical protein
LYQTIQDQLEILSTGEPTYWPTDINKIPDLVDIFIFKLLERNFLDIKPNLEIASDHIPIIATISTHIITHRKPSELHNSKKNGNHSEIKAKETND